MIAEYDDDIARACVKYGFFIAYYRMNPVADFDGVKYTELRGIYRWVTRSHASYGGDAPYPDLVAGDAHSRVGSVLRHAAAALCEQHGLRYVGLGDERETPLNLWSFDRRSVNFSFSERGFPGGQISEAMRDMQIYDMRLTLVTTGHGLTVHTADRSVSAPERWDVVPVEGVQADVCVVTESNIFGYVQCDGHVIRISGVRTNVCPRWSTSALIELEDILGSKGAVNYSFRSVRSVLTARFQIKRDGLDRDWETHWT